MGHSVIERNQVIQEGLVFYKHKKLSWTSSEQKFKYSQICWTLFVSPSDIFPSASRLEENIGREREWERYIWNIFYIWVCVCLCALSRSVIIRLLKIKQAGVVNIWWTHSLFSKNHPYNCIVKLFMQCIKNRNTINTVLYYIRSINTKQWNIKKRALYKNYDAGFMFQRNKLYISTFHNEKKIPKVSLFSKKTVFFAIIDWSFLCLPMSLQKKEK